MGQQQLLLIVLGVIIVGIAVVVGINVFSASSVQANRDALVADMMTVGNMAYQYYKKPTMLGGGGNAFTNFTVPQQLRGGGANALVANTPNGTVTVVITNANQLDITGVGTENGNDGSNPINYTLQVTAAGLGNVATVN